MAKKKKSNNNNDSLNNANNNVSVDKNNDGEKEEVKKKGGEKKEDKNQITVVLKVEMHCEGCASKIAKYARALEGVESAKAEMDSNKLTVIGKVDPLLIREDLHLKINKKVDIISPQYKKEDASKKDEDKKSNDKKTDTDTIDANSKNTKKPKEPPVTTAVLKLGFHCQGCIKRINKILSKTKGVEEMTLDKQKETVTVKGTMDVKGLTETLKDKLKRPVEVVPAKKEKEEAAGGGDKDGGNEGSGGKKKKGGGGDVGQEKSGGGDVATIEGYRPEFMAQPGFGQGYRYMGQPMYGNGYMGQPVMANGGYVGQPVMANGGYMGQPVYTHAPNYGYGYGSVPGYPAHLKFNDENPNACSIM
ncbi:hypothetical protein K2173_016602 [Erythroxylum novogranatense]|uniref:HMA domain-containing protein n=1 Tax=Erythroxylum novogranatense TaxID=1862640 RepID=A0AAV8SHB6_9ROSI|nr:hypothetical protein K2173_016602 [Erythroxylum novogranatense]